MKTLFIAIMSLAASLSQPAQTDCAPLDTSPTPNPVVYEREIESEFVDLNQICSWYEVVRPDKTFLTLYTYQGDCYVLGMKTMDYELEMEG